MVLLGVMSHVEARVGPFGGQSQRKIGTWFALNVPWEWNSFWAHPMVLLANGGQEEARFDLFGNSVNLVAR